LTALPEIVAEFPDVVYVVLGATHPGVVQKQGESYRLSLQRLAQKYGLSKSVIFFNRFVSIDELTAFIGAADIYITPYLHNAQITSGTLAYCFGAGKAIVSTPYWACGGTTCGRPRPARPFQRPHCHSGAVKYLLRNETQRQAMRKTAYTMGREMVWSRVAHLYVKTFE